MMVLKKKEIIAASLVVLIGLAGYLNWSYQDTVTVRDGESYIETGKKLGEAQYVNSVEEVEETAENVETVSDDGGYFEQARLDKESSRSKSLEILNKTAENQSFDEETRKKAGDKIMIQAQNIEKENQAESIAKSKGYNEICVYANEDNVTVTVRKDGFSEEDAVRLTELVSDNFKISAKNVKIVEVK